MSFNFGSIQLFEFSNVEINSLCNYIDNYSKIEKINKKKIDRRKQINISSKKSKQKKNQKIKKMYEHIINMHSLIKNKDFENLIIEVESFDKNILINK